ncbi:MAG: hypothetical protein LBS12_05730 [Prevotellaceae bacterium]|jgi:hypothetical protein|nr:hypothetical protein [Prevotellaceae bacterium]
MKSFPVIVTSLILALSTNAQAQGADTTVNNAPKNDVPRTECSLSAHLGYSRLLEEAVGLSNASKGHNNKLRSMFAADLQFEVRIAWFSCGVLFLSYVSIGSTEHTTDRVAIYSFMPQFGFYIIKPQPSRIAVKMQTGMGYAIYENNSTVFGQKRLAHQNCFAMSSSLSGLYRLSSHLSLSLEARYFASGHMHFNVNYHEQSFIVYQPFLLLQVGIMAGVNYTF